MPQISVIVPVYNAEKYIRRCVNSILSQTFTDFELILVDDGSKDASLTLLKEFKGEDKIRVFSKQNGGVSSARNFGLQQAQGEYIVFVDSDDYIDETYLEELYEARKHDLVVSSCVYEYEHSHKNMAIEPHVYETNEEIIRFLDYIRTQDTCVVVWCKLFRKDIINQNHLCFNGEINSGEDNLFIMDYLSTGLRSISVINNLSYHCNRSSGGLSTKVVPFDETFLLMDLLSEKMNKICLAYHCKPEQLCYNDYIANYMAILLKNWRSSNSGQVKKIKLFYKIITNRHIRRLLQDRSFLIHRSKLSLSKRFVHEAVYGALKVFYFFVH